MKEVKVKWVNKKKSISQVYSEGPEYAFLTENFEMIHQPVFCKDFMQDAIAGFLGKKRMAIYGFSYDPSTDLPIYWKKTRLLITDYSDKHMPNRIEGSLDFMNQIEKKLKMVRTKIYKVTNPPKQYSKSGAYVYDGSPRWMISPPMISLYTLLMRVGLVHKKGDNFMHTVKGVSNGSIPGLQGEDQSQMNSAKKALGWILDKTDKKLFHRQPADNYKDQEVSTMHNDLGIVSYSDGTARYNFPKWYKGVEV